MKLVHRDFDKEGALSNEHSESELRVIGNNHHRVDYYFLHLPMHYI